MFGVPPNPVSPSTAPVVIVDLAQESYSRAEVLRGWDRLLSGMACPACGQRGRFGHHGSYQKYHYHRRIRVVRVRCRGCRRTHAVLPAFSLPGTSAGTSEAEQYLLARETGSSRSQAGAELVGLGMAPSFGKQLERHLAVAVTRAKALWPAAANQRLTGLPWIRAACGGSVTPLLDLNRYCLARRVNAICFCRSAILLFGRTRAGPHNLHSAQPRLGAIGSPSRSSGARRSP
jgi:hypothetical protein